MVLKNCANANALGIAAKPLYSKEFHPQLMFDITKHPTIRAPSKNLYVASCEKDGIIRKFLPADSLYFTFTTSTEKEEADAILLWLNYFAQARSQLGILRVCKIALKHTILHPLTIGLEDFVDFSTTLILWNIVRNNNVHSY